MEVEGHSTIYVIPYVTLLSETSQIDTFHEILIFTYL